MVANISIRKIFAIFIAGLAIGAVIPTLFFQAEIREHKQEIESLNTELKSLNLTIVSLTEDINQYSAKITEMEEHKTVFYGGITTNQSRRLINLGQNLFLLDVRTEKEFNESKIQGAVNIPIDQLITKIDELNKTQEMLVYCKSGYRSSEAIELLRDNGFYKVYNMLKGLNGWEDENYPVEYSCPCQNN